MDSLTMSCNAGTPVPAPLFPILLVGQPRMFVDASVSGGGLFYPSAGVAQFSSCRY
jgi:hypothetical protein